MAEQSLGKRPTPDRNRTLAPKLMTREEAEELTSQIFDELDRFQARDGQEPWSPDEIFAVCHVIEKFATVAEKKRRRPCKTDDTG